MTKYLVNGVNGQLGYDIVRRLKEKNVPEENILCVDIEDMDITNQSDVNNIISNFKPDVIFHNAAYTNVNRAEIDQTTCYNVNYNGTKNIVNAASKIDAKIIYISTDYVFDGTKNGYYEINDNPNPINIYGMSKYKGELEVLKYKKSFIVRISWVFGINGNNFIKTMLKLSETKNEVDVVCDQIGSPTYTWDLANLLIEMSQTDKYGLYHASNDGVCSWEELTRYIFQINQINTKVNGITTEEYSKRTSSNSNTAVPSRPMNSRLSKSSLVNNGFDLLPDWHDAVDRFNNELKKRKREK